MKTIQEVASVYRTLAIAAAPVNKSPNATNRGNLRKQLGSYNTVAKMTSETQDKAAEKSSVSLSFNYAPPGATYGQFVEEGFTTRAGRTKSGRPYKQTKVPAVRFAQKALNSNEVKRAINEYFEGAILEYNKKVGTELQTEIESLFGKTIKV
jgi:hypothetical protein